MALADSPRSGIERYRRQAEERYQRLDEVLAAMPDNDEEAPGPGGHKGRGT